MSKPKPGAADLRARKMALFRATDDAVFGVLVEAAENGDPCPGKVTMAASTGGDQYMVGESLKRLRAAEKIEIVKGPSMCIRRIRIVETGKVTDWSRPPKGGAMSDAATLAAPPDWPADYSGQDVRFRRVVHPAAELGHG